MRGRIEIDDVERLARSARRTVGRVRTVPDRRVRLLQRFELDWHVFEGKMLAAKIECFAGEALQDYFDGFVVDFLRIGRIGAEIGKFDRRSAAAETELQPAAAHLIEHA